MAKTIKVSIDSKIKYLKCMLVELLKKTSESKDANKFDLQFSLSLDKVILYPFFLSTANGEDTRKTMFTHAFTIFKSNGNGIYESDIKDKIITSLTQHQKDELFKPFFKIYNLSKDKTTDKLSRIFLIPDWDEIENNSQNNLNNDGNCKLEIDNDNELLSRCVKHILDKYPKFLYYTIDELRTISYYHEMWKFLLFTDTETNFDEEIEDSYEKQRFIGQDSPLTPQQAKLTL